MSILRSKSTFQKNFGIGVGLRPQYYHYFLPALWTEKPKEVQWVEAISENFMRFQNGERLLKPLQNLKAVRAEFPVALHGVGMSLGSVEGISKKYLKDLKELILEIEPAWVSDHLCWGEIHGHHLHDLLPLPYTNEAIRVVSENIQRAQDFLKRQILVENVSSYAETSHSEMSEWDFLAEVAERADCGILLDINNIYVSAVNHGFDPHQYLNAIPAKRVGQMHLAGHSDYGTHIIDTHDEPVRDEVWELYKAAFKKFGAINAMIERDDNFPPWETLRQELQYLTQLQNGLSDVVAGPEEKKSKLVLPLQPALTKSTRKTKPLPGVSL